MEEQTLLLEVGSEALSDLTTDEKNAILGKYSEDEVRIAGMKVFYILMRKFQADYRMGRMYEDLSQKYEAYRRIYNWYAKTVSAGRVTSDPAEENYVVERYKFVKPTRS